MPIHLARRGAKSQAARRRWRSGWWALVLLALLVAVPPVAAIEELEAEEDIAELLPDKFPAGRPPDELRSREWAILPEFGFGPDTGVQLGGKFAHRDLFSSGAALDLDTTYALRKQVSIAFSIASPHLLEDRLLVLFRAKYHLDPQREFFGLGNNNVGPDPVSTHEFQEVGGALTVGWRPFKRVAFNFAVGVRKVDIRRGKRKDGFMFTPDEFPELPGVHGGIVNPIALSLVWNTRDDVLRPTRGWRVIVKVIHTNAALFSDFEFTRFLFDGAYLRSFSEGRQVFGLRVNGEWSIAPAEQVPFWELSELGSHDTLRGFFPHRFVGKGRVLLNGEFRFRLHEFDFLRLWHVRLDGVLFGDGGRVFIDRGDLTHEFMLDASIIERILSDFQFSAGTGFRIILSSALVARIDVGFSNEEKALLYLSFGQAF